MWLPASRSSFRFRPFKRHLVRCFATKYSGRVVLATDNGCSFGIEVDYSIPQADARGYLLPRRDLICKVANILQTRPSRTAPSDPFLELSDYLETINLTIAPSEASEILKALKSPILALKFFHFCSSEIPEFRHDAFTYNRIIHILSKSYLPNRLDLVSQVLDEMDRSGVRGTISTVNLLIGIYGDSEASREVEELERCLGLVKKWDLKLSCYTYKCLLQAYLRLNKLNKAVEVYGELKRRGYKLDIFACNMLLDALAKDEKLSGLAGEKWEARFAMIQNAVFSQVNEAYSIFTDMKRKHCGPDEYTYTIMIRMTGKNGRPDESLTFFQEMLSKGHSPNLISYNTVIQALAKARMVDKVLMLFSKMIQNSCRPNEFTYSLLLNVLAAEGQLGKLDEVVELSGKYMNKSIYAYLIRTLSKLGHSNEAHRLFCNMWRFHDTGDRNACLSMLESLCNAGKTAEALDLLSKVHEKGICTDTFMHNTVLSALSGLKSISHMDDLYEKMKKEGPSPDVFTYNILISGFGRAGKVDEAVRIFEELENSDFAPDVISYNSLINCLGKNGDLDEAHVKFREMQEKGLNPDVFTYSTLIECFGKTDKVDMAYELFNNMISDGCCPNIVTYNILLDCFEQCGRTAEAVDLYAKLKQQGLTPDSITDTILRRLQSCSRRANRVRKKNPITGWVVSPLG